MKKRKKEIKKGQLVKLSEDGARWSDFVNTSQLGIVVGQTEQGLTRVLFTSGELEDHWYFSLECVDEIT